LVSVTKGGAGQAWLPNACRAITCGVSRLQRMRAVERPLKPVDLTVFLAAAVALQRMRAVERPLKLPPPLDIVTARSGLQRMRAVERPLKLAG
jgi:hypothetical protein